MKTRVWKFIPDYEKEEAWLNEMAVKGFALTHSDPPHFYFEDTAPGEYTIRIACVEYYENHPETTHYIRFIEENDAEHVSTFGKWLYFRRKSEMGAFEIFSDIDSKIKHFKNIIKIVRSVFIFPVMIALINIFILIILRDAIVPIHAILALIFGGSAFWIASIWRNYLRKIKKLEEERILHEN